MRRIKFRGRSIKSKQFVYGFYCKQGIVGLHKILTFKKGFQGFIPVVVEPDSVAQFVGYDKNGKEVYEGDTLISATNEITHAALWAIDLTGLTLKEDNQ